MREGEVGTLRGREERTQREGQGAVCERNEQQEQGERHTKGQGGGNSEADGGHETETDRGTARETEEQLERQKDSVGGTAVSEIDGNSK